MNTVINGEKIRLTNGSLDIPNNPIIPFIEGDGIGPDIWKASQMVFDAAVAKASFESKMIVENAHELISTIIKLKPSSSKGDYVKSITMSSTMSPGVKVEPKSV